MSLPAPALNYLESLYEQALEEGYDENQAAAIAQAKFEGEDYVPTNRNPILPVDRFVSIGNNN
jgi:hypothetical protein